MSKSTASNSQQRPPKTMSSRLMTMKFMQRAVASTPPTAPESQPQNAEHPPSKRQKIGHESSPIATPISVSHSIQNVMDEEELKRVKAIERIAEEAGETKWTLSTVNQDPHDSSPNLRVTMAGYSEIDDGTRTPATHGRRTFGRYQEKEIFDDKANKSSSSSEEASDDSVDDSRNGEYSDEFGGSREPTRPSKQEDTRNSRTEQTARKSDQMRARAEFAGSAEKRRKKEVKLNKLTSISGVSESGGKPRGGKEDRECYSCGEKGHKRRDCPQRDHGRRQNAP